MSAPKRSRETLADLKRSGLTPKDAESMGIEDVSADWCQEHVGQNCAGYRIPYRNFDHQVIEDFYRVRFHIPAPKTFGGQEVSYNFERYLQPKGTGVMCYLSERINWRKTLTEKSISVVLTEGEKKAEAACKAGITCIGLGGVYNFANDGVFLEELAQLAAGRSIIICFDTDRNTNQNIRKAEIKLGALLQQSGASVRIAAIPAKGNAKIGLDDLLVAKGKKAVQAVLDAAVEFSAQPRTNYLIGPKAARPSHDELLGVPPKPKMIIDGYLQEDAGGDVGTGETGKSTLLLYEGVHIILGRPLYGRPIIRPGGYLVLTAEDDRDTTLSRLNQICRALELSKAEQLKVLGHFYVEDISSTSAKLIVADHSGIHETGLADEIISKYADLGLAVASIDPTSLLGPGELSGNDGMAQLMRTARKLHKKLSAAVRLVHHVSKQVARSEIHDQYSARGASSFADNSRSQRQIVKMYTRKFEHEGSEYELPEEITNLEIATGKVLAIFVHKMSYVERDSTPIILVRHGFAFRHVFMQRTDTSPAAEAERRNDEMFRVIDYVRGLLTAGKKIGKTELEEHAQKIGLTRKVLRAARDMALNSSALQELALPKNERTTNRTKYLMPLDKTNPANPAESRRNSAGEITGSRTVVAANPAAAVHAIAAAGLETAKTAIKAGAVEADSGRIPPNPAVGKRPLNGKAVDHG
jgi:hypothetical protein